MKHSPEQLQAWAKQAIAWKESGDSRWLQVVMALLLRGYDLSTVTHNIYLLAQGRQA